MVRKRRKHKTSNTDQDDVQEYQLIDYWEAKGKASNRRANKQKKYEEKKAKMKKVFDRDWN